MKYTLIFLLIIGCVDKYGVTDELTVYGAKSKEDVILILNQDLLVLCRKNGYHSVNILSRFTIKKRNGLYKAVGIGQCLKKLNIIKQDNKTSSICDIFPVTVMINFKERYMKLKEFRDYFDKAEDLLINNTNSHGNRDILGVCIALHWSFKSKGYLDNTLFIEDKKIWAINQLFEITTSPFFIEDDYFLGELTEENVPMRIMFLRNFEEQCVQEKIYKIL